MINNISIYVILIGIIFTGYQYTEYQKQKIYTLESNIKSQERYFNEKLKAVEFNIKFKEKKQTIEKELDIDESNNVNINSTRIYL